MSVKDRLVRLTTNNRVVPKVSEPSGNFWNVISPSKIGQSQYTVLRTGAVPGLSTSWIHFIDSFLEHKLLSDPNKSKTFHAKLTDIEDDSAKYKDDLRVVCVLAAGNPEAKELLFVAWPTGNTDAMKCFMEFSWNHQLNNFVQTA